MQEPPNTKNLARAQAAPDDPVQARLRARADDLARPYETADRHHAAGLEVLCFRRGPHRFAVPLVHVVQVHARQPIWPLPSTPAFIAGVVNVQGRVYSVTDLLPFLGLDVVPPADPAAVVLLREGAMTVGLLADGVEGDRVIDAAALQAPPLHLPARYRACLRGIASPHLLVLDVPQLLSTEGFVVDEASAY